MSYVASNPPIDHLGSHWAKRAWCVSYDRSISGLFWIGVSPSGQMSTMTGCFSLANECMRWEWQWRNQACCTDHIQFIKSLWIPNSSGDTATTTILFTFYISTVSVLVSSLISTNHTWNIGSFSIHNKLLFSLWTFVSYLCWNLQNSKGFTKPQAPLHVYNLTATLTLTKIQTYTSSISTSSSSCGSCR